MYSICVCVCVRVCVLCVLVCIISLQAHAMGELLLNHIINNYTSHVCSTRKVQYNEPA
jgi:hypothetical protein